MSEKNLDGYLTRNGRHELVKIRFFQGFDGQSWCDFDGSIFNGWEANLDQVDQLMSILQTVREGLGGADAKSTR